MKRKKTVKRLSILVLVCSMAVGLGFQVADANAVDKLTIKIGYFGWPASDYVEKAVFKASDLYAMGTVKENYTYWDGGKRVAIDSSIGVPLTTIIDAAGIDQSSIAQMDFWTADSGNGAFTSFTWRQLIGTKRYYFKDLADCFEYEGEDEEEAEPEKPEEEEKPDKPEEPGTPEEPDKPDEPETPDKPDEPEKPDKPEKPEEPEKPEKPEEPEEPENEGDKVSFLEDLFVPVYAETKSKKIIINKDKAWKNAKKVPAMMALEENWTWYEIGTSDATGTDNLGTSNRFRLNFGQAAPDEKRTFNSAKQVHTIYVMFSGTPVLTSKETNIKGKVGSSHQLKVAAAAADEELEGIVESGIVWSSSNSDVVSVDQNGRLHFNKDGKATIYAKSGGAVKEFTVSVGDVDSDGTGDGDGSGSENGNGNGSGNGKAAGNSSDKKEAGNNTSDKHEKVKVDITPNSFVLSDAASQKLRSALNRQASEDEASMNTHQEEMDDDAEQLMIKKDTDNMAIALVGVNSLIAGAGVAFGLYRFKKQKVG